MPERRSTTHHGDRHDIKPESSGPSPAAVRGRVVSTRQCVAVATADRRIVPASGSLTDHTARQGRRRERCSAQPYGLCRLPLLRHDQVCRRHSARGMVVRSIGTGPQRRRLAGLYCTSARPTESGAQAAIINHLTIRVVELEQVQQ